MNHILLFLTGKPFKTSISFNYCAANVNCSFSLDSESDCEIRYGTDTNVLEQVTGPMNELIQLPLKPLTRYNLQFIATINSVLRVKILKEFTTGECMSKYC